MSVDAQTILNGTINSTTAAFTGQTINAGVTALSSTNVFDLGDTNHQIGDVVKKIKLRLMVGTAFTGSSTSWTFSLQDSLTAGGSFADTEIKLTGVLKAALVAGAQIFDVDLPKTGGASSISLTGYTYPNQSPLRRFIKTLITAAGTSTTNAGTVMGWLDVF